MGSIATNHCKCSQWDFPNDSWIGSLTFNPQREDWWILSESVLSAFVNPIVFEVLYSTTCLNSHGSATPRDSSHSADCPRPNNRPIDQSWYALSKKCTVERLLILDVG